jgi:hypothetical protein
VNPRATRPDARHARQHRCPRRTRSWSTSRASTIRSAVPRSRIRPPWCSRPARASTATARSEAALIELFQGLGSGERLALRGSGLGDGSGGGTLYEVKSQVQH